MAMLTQSPSAVPNAQLRTWSMAAEAAEAAELAPRALIMAAPRCCTVGMKVSLYQASSTRLLAGLPLTVAWPISGYWVALWLPHTTIFLMSVTWLPVWSASCDRARLWSRRIMAVNWRG